MGTVLTGEVRADLKGASTVTGGQFSYRKKPLSRLFAGQQRLGVGAGMVKCKSETEEGCSDLARSRRGSSNKITMDPDRTTF